MEGERYLNLELVDSTGVALAGRQCTVSFEGGETSPVVLDEGGRLSVAVPPGARRATLVVATRRFELSLALPDAATVAGAQERLNHLDYFAGRVDGQLGSQTQTALRCFQSGQRLPPTGALDAATVARLREEHGS